MTDRRRALFALEVAGVVVAILPIAVAVARGIARGWLPVGDDALFELRARDVLTAHNPLLGTWTSASLSLGRNVNNPGPLYFDLLALPTKLGHASGLAIGVALVNAAMVVLIAVVAHRRAGAIGALAATAMAAALCWTLGSELLFDPWQPHSLLLPFLAFLVVVWALSGGDAVMLPWAAGLGTLIVQTHLSYAILLPALSAIGVAGLAVASVRARREHGWPAAKRRLMVSLAATAVVVVVTWAQPVQQQLFGPGDGNLAKVATSAGSSSATVGGALAARITASILAVPPFWSRPSFARAFLPPNGEPPVVGRIPNLAGLPAVAASIAGLMAVLAVLVGAVLLTARRAPEAAHAAGLALTAVLLGVVTSALLPVGRFGIAQHQLRWLWPIALFASFSVLLTIASLLARQGRDGEAGSRAVPVAAGLLLVVVIAAAGNLPYYNAAVGPRADDDAIGSVRALAPQLGVLAGKGPLLVDTRDLRFAEPYSAVVMSELARRGIPFLVDDDGWADQVGASRRYRGSAAGKLVLREGDAAMSQDASARRVAIVEGLSARERTELAAAREEVERLATAAGVQLNGRGQAAMKRGELPTFAGSTPPLPADLVASGELAALVEADYVVLPRSSAAVYRRYAELQHRWDRRTIGLFLTPVTP